MAKQIFGVLAAVSLWASGAPAQTPADAPDMSQACREHFRNWQDQVSFGAFAVREDGACGWYWGAGSMEEARERALSNCRSGAETGLAPCQIVSTHSANLRPYTLSDRCRALLTDYLDAKEKKAFALARNGSCGYGHGFPTQPEAEARAIEECQSAGGTDCRIERGAP